MRFSKLAAALCVVALLVLPGCSALRTIGIGDGEFAGLVVTAPPVVDGSGYVRLQVAHPKTGVTLDVAVPPGAPHYRAWLGLTLLEHLGGGMVGDLRSGEAFVDAAPSAP